MPATESASVPKLGVNLNHFAEWILNGAFTNAFLECKRWNGSPTLDADGWPTAGWPASTSLMSNVGATNIRTGTYHVFFQGSGSISISGSASATITASGQTFSVTAATNAGIGVTVASSSAAPNHVRAIAVVHDDDLADYTAGETFTDRFRGAISATGSIIRFMDPLATNGSQTINWTDLPPTTFYSQNSASASGVGSSTRGMSIDFAIELCNKTGCDLWLNVPHRATDSFCQSLFARVKSYLATGRLCYIELSNEVWNATFDRAAGDTGPTDNGQYTYFLNLSNSLGLGGVNNVDKRQRAYKRRAIEVFDIALATFGGTSRIRRVLSGQKGVRGPLDYALTFESQNNHKIDHIAIASYWGGQVLNPAQNPAGRKPTTLDEYFADLSVARAMSESIDASDIAYYQSTYGKSVVGYEGGLVAGISPAGGWAADPNLHALVNAAIADSRMYDQYRSWLVNCKTNGYELMCHYGLVYPYPAVGSDQGRWGLKEHIYESNASSQRFLAMRNAKAGQ